MIGHFPTPLPDELLYSLCARYSNQVQYPSKESINLELFGTSRGPVAIHLPVKLGHLSANLPPNYCYTVDQLIDNHTLFNYYAPFIPKNRVDRLRQTMKAGKGNIITHVSGISASTIKPYEYLRYCPVCAQEDKKIFGEYYWHRLHQVTGVEVCSKHYVFLQNSNALFRNQSSYSAYLSAAQAITTIQATPFNPSNSINKSLLLIAQNAEWLLNQQRLEPGFELIHSCYLELLLVKGLATYSGETQCHKLKAALTDYYSSDILKLLQCEININIQSIWPKRIVNDLLREKAHHPLRYLLLMQLLGHSAESFFTQCTIETSQRVRALLHPFGEGPWPCLNPTCKSFRRMTIKQCHITHQKYAARYKDGNRCLVAAFRCVCGFTYCRRELDLPNLGKYEYSFIKLYGGIWDEALKRLWVDRSISLKRIVNELGTSTHTIKRQAARLCLDFPRVGTKSFVTNLNLEIKRRIYQKDTKHSRKLSLNRKKWLSALEHNSTLTHSWLRQNKLYGVYLWLRKYDTKWLNEHMSQPYKRTKPTRTVDWNSLDHLLAGEIKGAVTLLKSASGRPVRITKHALALAIKRVTLYHNLPKLPITAKILSEVVETREAFAIRRLRWAGDYFREGQISPSRSSLMRRTSVEHIIWRRPPMKSIFREVWISLQHPQLTANTEAA